jgi:hypothetical protein
MTRFRPLLLVSFGRGTSLTFLGREPKVYLPEGAEGPGLSGKVG